MPSNKEREPLVFWQIEEGFCFSVSGSYVHESGKLNAGRLFQGCMMVKRKTWVVFSGFYSN
jgi:hypothetical protein